jgi:hypothetical protein
MLFEFQFAGGPRRQASWRPWQAPVLFKETYLLIGDLVLKLGLKYISAEWQLVNLSALTLQRLSLSHRVSAVSVSTADLCTFTSLSDKPRPPNSNGKWPRARALARLRLIPSRQASGVSQTQSPSVNCDCEPRVGLPTPSHLTHQGRVHQACPVTRPAGVSQHDVGSCLPYSLMAAGTKRGDLEGARSDRQRHRCYTRVHRVHGHLQSPRVHVHTPCTRRVHVSICTYENYVTTRLSHIYVT